MGYLGFIEMSNIEQIQYTSLVMDPRMKKVVEALHFMVPSIAEFSVPGGYAYVAGGFVRDILAGDHVGDIDIFVNASHLPPNDWELTQSKVHMTSYMYDYGVSIQVIETDKTIREVVSEFDFSCCAAAVPIPHQHGDRFAQMVEHPYFRPDLEARKLRVLGPLGYPRSTAWRLAKLTEKGYVADAATLRAIANSLSERCIYRDNRGMDDGVDTFADDPMFDDRAHARCARDLSERELSDTVKAYEGAAS